MPDTTPILALPFLVPNQAQPYVTHNEALRRLDILVQLSVAQFGAEAPPAAPEEGDLYALGAAPTGAWAGQPQALAVWLDNAWLFIAPQQGWRAWGRAEAELRVWDGAGWIKPPAELDNVAGLGIGTASDAVNRLAVKAEATLLSHDGADHRVKVNKAGDTDTAALLFQSGWTGHAEMGLAGDDDFSIKVSLDGSSWTSALTLNKTTGLATGAAVQSGPADTTSGRLPVMGANDVRFRLVNAHQHFRPGYSTATGGGASGQLYGFGDKISLVPTDQAGSYAFTKELFFDAAGDAVWSVEGGLVVSGGNVGIGTASPAYDLDIAGTINASESANGQAGRIENTNAGFTGTALNIETVKAGASTFNFCRMVSDNGGASDVEFRFRGDGNGTCDGSWTGGGADYAEYFEWADGNQNGEDRVGMAVVLDGDRIKPALAGEIPFGVISGNPSVVGDGDIDHWKGKYLRDDFGRYIWEDYEVVEWAAQGEAGEVRHSYAADAVPEGVTVPADATRTAQQRRKLNPEHDPDRPYTPRAERPEWDMVGLIGKLRLRKGQPVGARWIRMREVSAPVEEWLVQ